jgi:hypothetical protein
VLQRTREDLQYASATPRDEHARVVHVVPELRSGDVGSLCPSETREASPPRKGDSADLQLFENENQVAPKASFAGHMSIESTPKPVCPAGHVLPEPKLVGSLLVKPGFSRLCRRGKAPDRSFRLE